MVYRCRYDVSKLIDDDGIPGLSLSRVLTNQIEEIYVVVRF
jgi:hypothetical protein